MASDRPAADLATDELLNELAGALDRYLSVRRAYTQKSDAAEAAVGSGRNFDRLLAQMDSASDAVIASQTRFSELLHEATMFRQITFTADEQDAASTAVRYRLGAGEFDVYVKLAASMEFEDEDVFRAIAVAKAGVPPRELEDLVLRATHLGEQLLVAGIPLATAVSLKDLLDTTGATTRIVEERSAPETTRAAIPERVRHEVWRRDEGRCVDCGSRERLEYDHIIALANGGSNTARNIELRCESCNRKKGASI
jgi:hypothetical protein